MFTAWRKSSYSEGGTHSECVEVGLCEGLTWQKSSYSEGGQGQCVEVGAGERVIGVRDTKDRDGGTLVVSRAAFRGLVALARR
jgi:hypothetical protein